MAYKPNTWIDEVEGIQEGTNVDAAHLNHIEKGIEATSESVIGENILPYPYSSESPATVGGITFTVQEEGRVLVDGTATEAARFDLNVLDGLAGNKVTLGIDSPSVKLVLEYTNGEEVTTCVTSADLQARTFTIPSTATDFKAYLLVPAGSNITEEVVSPMLELGIDGHAFQPYSLNREAIKAIADAAMSRAGGTFEGKVMAEGNADYDVAQVRNVVITSTAPSVGSSTDLPNGTLIVVYS